MTRFFIVRHGQTNYNVLGYYQGQLDTPLNEVGVKQAQEFKERFLKSGIHIDEIWSSDLQRARYTILPIAEALGLPIHLHAGLREVHVGDFTDKSHILVRQLYPHELAQFVEKGNEAAYPNGESRAEVRARIYKALCDIAEKNEGKTVLAASHGGTIHSLVEEISLRLGIEKPSVTVPNCALFLFEYENGKIILQSMKDENGEEISYSDITNENQKEAVL